MWRSLRKERKANVFVELFIPIFLFPSKVYTSTETPFVVIQVKTDGCTFMALSFPLNLELLEGKKKKWKRFRREKKKVG